MTGTKSGANVALSVSEAAARVGLTAATLRTWHRRYGLGPSIRTEGGHRRYNALDLARLRVVQQLVDGGVPPSEAVAASLELSPTALAAPTTIHPPRHHGRAGGGRVIAIPGGDEIQRGLARAAVSLDGPEIRSRVAKLLAEQGVIATWEQVLVPLLTALGERWYQTKRGVEIEHVTADALGQVLQGHGAAVLTDQRPILLACVPEEQHTLPLLALQAALRETESAAVMLGARVPVDAIHDAVRRLRPRRLVLWAQLPTVADASVFGDLPTQRPPLRVMAAGPGWRGAALAEDVVQPESLAEAVELLTA